VGFVANVVCAGGSSPIEEAGTESVAIADVSGTVEDGASCSDEATDDDRRSAVVTGSVKAAGACSGEGVGCLVRALYEKEMSCPVDESNTSCEAVAD
jgi:hypothetical protein